MGYCLEMCGVNAELVVAEVVYLEFSRNRSYKELISVAMGESLTFNTSIYAVSAIGVNCVFVSRPANTSSPNPATREWVRTDLRTEPSRGRV